MPDMSELVKMHGSVRKMRVKVAVEHADGFVHEVSLPQVAKRGGVDADGFHGELIKAANIIALGDIATDEREKTARSKK